jgi:hypothetical protein
MDKKHYDFIVDGISILYRKTENERLAIQTKIREAENILYSDTITHVKFIELSNELDELKREYQEKYAFANGVAQAREIVLDHMEYIN